MSSSFVVSPMSQKIDLKAGETYHGYITVANPANSTEDFSFRVSLSPYSVSGTNYEADFSTKSDWSRIVDWMALEETSGTLRPNETKKINFTIKVPKDAPAGGQYAMIGIASDKEKNSTVQDTFEMASLIYAAVEGETKHEGKIEGNSVPGFVASGVPTTKVTVSNNGNVHEIATTTIKVKNNLTGEEIKLSDRDNDSYDTVIMPSSTREIIRELSGMPQLGVFEVSQTVSYLGEETNITTVMVICPIWFMALVLGLIVSVVGMVCFSVHLRRKKLAD